MKNITPETVSRRKQYNEKKERNRERSKKGSKSWAEINTENYLKKNKIKKEYSTNPFWSMSDEDRQKLREY